MDSSGLLEINYRKSFTLTTTPLTNSDIPKKKHDSIYPLLSWIIILLEWVYRLEIFAFQFLKAMRSGCLFPDNGGYLPVLGRSYIRGLIGRI